MKHVLYGILLGWCVGSLVWLKVREYGRPTCPKSGGECSCKYCACPDGCPGVCLADTIMRAGGVITMYADPVAKECGEYGVFARVEANGKDGEPRTVAISMKDTACEAFADLAKQMKLADGACCK